MADTYFDWLEKETPTRWWHDSGNPDEIDFYNSYIEHKKKAGLRLYRLHQLHGVHTGMPRQSDPVCVGQRTESRFPLQERAYQPGRDHPGKQTGPSRSGMIPTADHMI